MGVVYAGCFNSLGGLQQFPQDAGGSASGKLLQYVLGYGKDGPVVDLQDIFPGRQYLTLGVCNIGAAHQPQRVHLLVHPCDALVEDHGVSDDGAGHAAGLGNVAHSQQPSDDRSDIGAELGHVLQQVGGLPNALLEGIGRLFHGFLWYGYQSCKVSQIGCRTLKPSRFREAAAVLVQDIVGKTGFGEDLAQVIGVLYNLRVANCDSSLDSSGLSLHVKPQPFGGVLFDLRGRRIFGFDDYWRAPRRGYQHIGVAARMVGEGLGVLGADFAARHHAPQQVAQRVVGIRLGLACHTYIQAVSLRPTLFLSPLWD